LTQKLLKNKNQQIVILLKSANGKRKNKSNINPPAGGQVKTQNLNLKSQNYMLKLKTKKL